MKRIRLTAIARRDIDEIWENIAAENMDAADRIVDGFYEIMSKLRQFPLMGAPRDHLRPGTRSFAYKKYLLFYTTIEDAVVVLRVIYGGRDVESLDFPTN